MDRLDHAVWEEVCRLLEEPERLEEEYRQHLHPSQDPQEVRTLEAHMVKIRRGITRLIDGYAEGLLDKEEFEPRITQLRERLHHLEQQLHEIRDLTHEDEEVRLLLSHFEVFAARVRDGLGQADWTSRREIIRLLVKRVEIDKEQVRVVFRVTPTTPPPAPDAQSRESADTINSQSHGERVLAPGVQRPGERL